MKHPRKVALVNVFEKPRELYDAHWEIRVDPESFAWQADILHNSVPQAWSHQGKMTAERPDVPWPVYPPNPCVTVEAFNRMSAADQLRQRELDLAWRAEIKAIFESHPIPFYVLESTSGQGKTRDEADTAAQTWVLERIEKYAKTNVPPMTEARANQLVAELDRARLSGNFAAADRARGLLKAYGLKLTEPEKASDPTPTKWTKE